MNAIKKYLRRRRQSDAVKLMTLLFVLLAVFLFLLLSELVRYSRTAHTKTEYLLTSNETAERVRPKLARIREMDGNLAADIQREYPITLDGGQTTVLVRECTAAYLSAAYGISDKAFHLNAAAYKAQSNQSTEFTARYQKDAKTVSGLFTLDQTLGDHTPFALKCRSGGMGGTSDDGVLVCAMFQSADPSGATEQALEGMGFEIRNASEMERQTYQQALLLMKMKYHFAAIVLISLFVAVLFRIMRTKKHGCSDATL